MTTKNNKLFLYVLMIGFVFTLAIGQTKASNYINYYGISMSTQEYNNLTNLGFSEEEIYYMDEQTFLDNKDLSAILVAKNEKYYKSIYTDLNGDSYSVEITKEEYDNQGSITTRGYVETEYKYVTSTIAQNGTKYRYKVSMSWKSIPSTHSYDIIGIGFEDNVSISGLVNFYYYSCDSDENCGTSGAFYDKKELSTGGSVVYKIPEDIAALSATLYYDVSKNTTDTITHLDICGDYSHATSNVGSSLYTDYTININGIVLGSGFSYYDAIPCATASWSGSW